MQRCGSLKLGQHFFIQNADSQFISGKHRSEHFQDAIVEKSKQQQQKKNKFILFPFFVWPSFIIPWRASTVKPRPKDTRLIRTLLYNGQFRLSQRKAHICPQIGGHQLTQTKHTFRVPSLRNFTGGI